MTDRERAIKAIRRGVPLGEVVMCSCHSTPPTRNGCFGVCEDSVAAIIASYEEVRQDAFDLGFKAAGGSIYPLNEDTSGQRREPMSPHPLDDDPPFEIQESK